MNAGELPGGWIRSTLGEVCWRPQYGWTTKAAFADGSAKLLRTTDITSGIVDWDHVPFCSESPPNVDKYRLVDGDIVVSRAGSVGASTLLRNVPHDAVFASYLIRLRPIKPMETRYVAYFLQSADYWTAIARRSAGIAMPNVNANKLATIEIPVAPVDEQRRIVAQIEELISDLDAGVASLDRVRRALGRHRASVLRAALSGEMTKEWRQDNPDVESAAVLLHRVLEDRRERWEETRLVHFAANGRRSPVGRRSMYREGIGPPLDTPSLPAHWCWARMDQLAFFVTSGSRGWAKFYSDDGALFIRAQDLKHDFLELDNVARVNPPAGSEGSRTIVKRHDLLVTITGANVTKTGCVLEEPAEAYVSQHVGLVRPVLGDMCRYLYYWLVSPSGGRRQLLQAAYGAGKPGLALDDLREVLVPVPPLREQHAIVGLLDAQLDTFSACSIAVAEAEVRSRRLREAILARAFEGRLVSQDPSDEPSPMLLERILAERAMGEQPKRRRRYGAVGRRDNQLLISVFPSDLTE